MFYRCIIESFIGLQPLFPWSTRLFGVHSTKRHGLNVQHHISNDLLSDCRLVSLIRMTSLSINAIIIDCNIKTLYFAWSNSEWWMCTSIRLTVIPDSSQQTSWRHHGTSESSPLHVRCILALDGVRVAATPVDTLGLLLDRVAVSWIFLSSWTKRCALRRSRERLAASSEWHHALQPVGIWSASSLARVARVLESRQFVDNCGQSSGKPSGDQCAS